MQYTEKQEMQFEFIKACHTIARLANDEFLIDLDNVYGLGDLAEDETAEDWKDYITDEEHPEHFNDLANFYARHVRKVLKSGVFIGSCAADMQVICSSNRE